MTLKGEYEPSPEAWVREQVDAYESSGGTEKTTLNGVPVVVVTSVGARSGKLRKNPVMRVEHEGTYALVASKGGAPSHPVWYHNLRSDPHIELQDGPDRDDYVVRLAEGDERHVWWDRAVAVWPAYADYATRTDREIPVFLAERQGRADRRT
jgi:deazaflavin-dependent oxidoreductase (nitroreductase family)